jgi:hypothetical protein
MEGRNGYAQCGVLQASKCDAAIPVEIKLFMVIRNMYPTVRQLDTTAHIRRQRKYVAVHHKPRRVIADDCSLRALLAHDDVAPAA